MKYFSLFSKEEIHTKAGQKVIPAKEFEALTSADALLEKVQDDAKSYREKIVTECELLKEEAARSGFQHGLEKLNSNILELDNLIKNLSKEINKQILPLAIKAARKILGEELKLHPDRIVDIVMQALKPIAQHHKIIIYANKSDIDILESKKSKIRKILEQVDSFSIRERDDIEPGGCMIETEAGIINAQLENQWRALESVFESYMKK